MVQGIDCAAKLTAAAAAAIKAAGYAFAGRYLVPNSGSLAWKALTPGEARIITDAGLRILAVWETTAARPKAGASAGAEDGVKAYQLAKSMDMPPSGIIYFAVDYEAGSADFDAIAAYLKAARAQTEEYEVGVYGSYSVVEAMRRRGACRGFWQCLAWSYGKKSPYLTVYQGGYGKTVGGVSVDINDCPDMDAAGIWGYGSAARADTPLKSVEEAAREVLAGAWDVGEARRRKLTAAGYDYDAVQAEVNRLLGEMETTNVGAEAMKEDEKDMDVDKLLDALTPERCYEIVQRAQEYAGTLPVSGWAVEKLQQAAWDGITDATRPRALVTREEAAIMADRAKGGPKV